MKVKFHRVGKTWVVPAIVIRPSTIPGRFIVAHLPTGKKKKVCGFDEAKRFAEQWARAILL